MIRVTKLFTAALTVALFGLALTASADDFLHNLFGKKGVIGSGNLVTESRAIDKFDRIDIRGSFDLYITLGNEYSLELTADDNIIELIDTEVRGKTLRLDSDHSYSSRKGCKIVITTPTLERISLKGSGEIEVLNLNQKMLEFEMSGSGDFSAEGSVDELELSISGSGEIDTRKLEAKSAYCRISGSGDIKVTAIEDFDGRVSGSGDIDVYGDPEHFSKRVSGSGSIKKR